MCVSVCVCMYEESDQIILINRTSNANFEQQEWIYIFET